MRRQPKALSEITHQAFGILSKELGVADTIRFIGQFTTGYGNYTEDRAALFDGMSFEDIVAEMKAGRESGHDRE